jgi:hypothetical protein
LRANAREIARPVEDAIKRGIPSAPPISGMTPAVVPGRLTWNTGFPANSTTIQTPRLAKKKQYNSIARVRTRSAALGIADMAGRSRRAMNRYEFTREYPYSLSPTGSRKHRISATGSRKFIENLDSGRGVKKGSASRFVWPSAEKALPFARYKMENVLNFDLLVVSFLCFAQPTVIRTIAIIFVTGCSNEVNLSAASFICPKEAIPNGEINHATTPITNCVWISDKVIIAILRSNAENTVQLEHLQQQLLMLKVPNRQSQNVLFE